MGRTVQNNTCGRLGRGTCCPEAGERGALELAVDGEGRGLGVAPVDCSAKLSPGALGPCLQHLWTAAHLLEDPVDPNKGRGGAGRGKRREQHNLSTWMPHKRGGGACPGDGKKCGRKRGGDMERPG